MKITQDKIQDVCLIAYSEYQAICNNQTSNIDSPKIEYCDYITTKDYVDNVELIRLVCKMDKSAIFTGVQPLTLTEYGVFGLKVCDRKSLHMAVSVDAKCVEFVKLQVDKFFSTCNNNITCVPLMHIDKNYVDYSQYNFRNNELGIAAMVCNTTLNDILNTIDESCIHSKTHLEHLLVKIGESSESIQKTTQRGVANIIIASHNLEEYFTKQDETIFTLSDDPIDPYSDWFQLGTIVSGGNEITVVIDRQTTDKVYVGYVGENYMDSGLIYSPILPILNLVKYYEEASIVKYQGLTWNNTDYYRVIDIEKD